MTNYMYDGVGGRTIVVENGDTTKYQVNNMNEYSSINTNSQINLSYDENGNLVQLDHTKFQYDFENRLIALIDTDTILFQHGPLGRKVSKVCNKSEIEYLFLGDRLIEKIDIKSDEVSSFIFGYGLDDLCSFSTSSEEYFFHSNALGSTYSISNDEGVGIEYYGYEGYGEPHVFNGNFEPIIESNILMIPLFTGRNYEDGYYYVSVRQTTLPMGYAPPLRVGGLQGHCSYPRYDLR